MDDDFYDDEHFVGLPGVAALVVAVISALAILGLALLLLAIF